MREGVVWDRFDLVVFDMDGTLYDQARLRRRMMSLLAGETMRSGSLSVPRTLAAYRRRRERLAGDSPAAQYDLPGHAPEEVRALVAEWMERRPLPLLRSCRTAGAETLFAWLARRRTVAVFSDYPAQDKLAALGLTAHLTVAAEEVGRLKPDPAGLRWLMERAAVDPARTLMIGDRDDRDGEAARRAGVRALIRGRDFRHFQDRIFVDAA